MGRVEAYVQTCTMLFILNFHRTKGIARNKSSHTCTRNDNAFIAVLMRVAEVNDFFNECCIFSNVARSVVKIDKH